MTTTFGPSEYIHPIYTTTFEVLARSTSLSRRLVARGRVDGTALVADHFSVGRGGLDLWDYTRATAVDPDAFDLLLPVFSGNFSALEFPNPSCVCYYCVLDLLDANAPLGEIGIFSKIVNSPIPQENGRVFLSSLAHFPLKCKNQDTKLAIRVLVQA